MSGTRKTKTGMSKLSLTELSFVQLCEEYLLSRQGSPLRPKSRSFERYCADALTKILDGVSLNELTAELIESKLALRPELSLSTQRSLVFALRRILEYGVASKVVGTNPALSVVPADPGTTKPKAFFKEDVLRLLAAFPQNRFSGVRNRVIAENKDNGRRR